MWIIRMSNVVEISQEAGEMLIRSLSRHLSSQASQPRFMPHNVVSSWWEGEAALASPSPGT